MPKKTPTTKTSELIGLETIGELIGDKRKLFWLNFQTGFVRGVAGVVGAAIAIVLIGFLVARLGGLPYIGDFFQELGNATTQTQTQPK